MTLRKWFEQDCILNLITHIQFYDWPNDLAYMEDPEAGWEKFIFGPYVIKWGTLDSAILDIEFNPYAQNSNLPLFYLWTETHVYSVGCDPRGHLRLDSAPRNPL